jgi:hypothetical protein
MLMPMLTFVVGNLFRRLVVTSTEAFSGPATDHAPPCYTTSSDWSILLVEAVGYYLRSSNGLVHPGARVNSTQYGWRPGFGAKAKAHRM